MSRRVETTLPFFLNPLLSFLALAESEHPDPSHASTPFLGRSSIRRSTKALFDQPFLFSPFRPSSFRSEAKQTFSIYLAEPDDKEEQQRSIRQQNETRGGREGRNGS
jgi:hypothetical protein